MRARIGLWPSATPHADSEFERVIDYTDWKTDAAREGPYSKGSARGAYRMSDRLDGFLGLPALGWFVAIMEQDMTLGIVATVAWAAVLAIWTPWILWRVWARNPPGNLRHAGGRLAIAWALLAGLTPVASSAVGLVVFPLVYVAGLVLMYLALTAPPVGPPATP